MCAVAIRDDINPQELRRQARQESDGRVAARLFAIANALEGMDRASAARLAGMDQERWSVSYSETGMLRLLWSLDLSHPRPGRAIRKPTRRHSKPSKRGLCSAPERDRTGAPRGRAV